MVRGFASLYHGMDELAKLFSEVWVQTCSHSHRETGDKVSSNTRTAGISTLSQVWQSKVAVHVQK